MVCCLFQQPACSVCCLFQQPAYSQCVYVFCLFMVSCLFQQAACSQCVVCFSNQCVHSVVSLFMVLSVSATSIFTVFYLFQQPAYSQRCYLVHGVLSVSATSIFTMCCLPQPPACSQCCLFQQPAYSQCVVCFSNQRVHSVPGWFPGGLGVHHVRRHRQFAIVESLPLFHLSHLLSGLAGEGVYFWCSVSNQLAVNCF